MKLAFCIYKYFSFGGLQRDFLRIALGCQQKGYDIQVFTMEWLGDIPKGFQVTLLPVKGLSNHRRCLRFSQLLRKHLNKTSTDYQAVIGFNRLPCLDIYFAGDVCYQAAARSQHSWLYRLTSRYRVYARLEKSVFASDANTQILLISESEKKRYQSCYNTPDERFYLLPAGIAEDRRPLSENSAIREQVRAELSLSPDQKIVLMIGSSFNTKGVDRALLAIASLPIDMLSHTTLVVIGKGNTKPYLRAASRLKIANNVKFLGVRDDILRFLWAADLLLHPAYYEAGGMVILEALVSGLPVLVTANCGYAYAIREAKAGIVLDMPFEQLKLNNTLYFMLNLSQKALAEYKNNGLDYASKHDFYQLTEKAVAFIDHYSQLSSQRP